MRKTYLISYDLDKPGQSYSALTTRLRQLGAVEALRSDWLLMDTAGAEAIRNDLHRFMDANDRILVVGLTGEAAWSNLLIHNETVKQTLAA